MSQKIFEVKDSQVGSRYEQIQNTLRALDGVQKVDVSPGGGTVTVEYDAMQTDPLRMKEALQRQGIEATDWPPDED